MAIIGRRFFGYSSFPGAAGTDISAIAPDRNDPGLTPIAGEGPAGVAFATDGNGNLVMAASGDYAKFNAPSASGDYDVEFVFASASGNYSAGGYLQQDASTTYVGLLDGVNGVGLGKYGAVQTQPVSITFPAALTFQFRRTGGATVITPVLNGTALNPLTDSSPNSLPIASAGSLLCSSGTATLKSFGLRNVPATTATLAPPSPASGQAGSESGAWTITLDQPAGDGGIAINLASSAAGDTFHATAGGSAVTSVTIPDGGTSITFLLVPAAAGSRNVAITSAGLTIAGSPITYAASAAPVAPANATGYTLATSAASVLTGTAETITATLTGGTSLASSLIIALADSLAATISGTITIANGSTTGTATITPSAAGTHAITAAHTGGGFTGGDGSTSFAATAAPAAVGSTTSSVRGFAPGLTTVGYTGRDATGALAAARSVAGVHECSPGVYATGQAPPAFEIRWDDGNGNIASDFPTYVTAGSLTVTGITYDQFTAFFAARDLTPIPQSDFDAVAAGLIANQAFVGELAAQVALGLQIVPNAAPTGSPAYNLAAIPAVLAAATGAQTAATAAVTQATAAGTAANGAQAAALAAEAAAGTSVIDPNLAANLAAVKAKTDLLSFNQAGSLINLILAAAGLDQVTIEPGINARQALSPILAASAGIVTGGGAIGNGQANVAAPQVGPTPGANRITATMQNGTRTNVVLTLPT